MKKVVMALLCLAAPLSAMGDDFGIRIGADLGGVSIDFRAGDDGFVSWNDDLYVPTRRECNLIGVYVGVEGDAVEINDLDVVFGNGREQDVSVRQFFRPGSYSRAKSLNGGKRCIVGFKLDANTLSRARGSRAWVTLYGQQVRPNGRIREVKLGSVRIADYFNRREWHERWGDWRRHDRDRDDDKVRICIGGFCFEP